MGRKRGPDNLDLDSRRAMDAGYGVHYGLYKAANPTTAYTQEEQPDTRVSFCRICRRKFQYRPRRKYCCPECVMEARRIRERKTKQ